MTVSTVDGDQACDRTKELLDFGEDTPLVGVSLVDGCYLAGRL